MSDGITFDLGDVLDAVRMFVHDFAQTQLRPLAREADEKGTVEPHIIEQLGRIAGGRTSIVPDEGAGREGPGVTSVANRISVLGSEELAWGDAAMILNIPGPGLAGPSISSAGTPDQHRRFLSEGFDGQGPPLGALAGAEAPAGAHRPNPRTPPGRHGGEGGLNG